MTATATATATEITTVLTVQELAASSPALRKADDRLYWAADYYRLYRDLLDAFPHCRTYRDLVIEASAELDAAEAAFDTALRRAESRHYARKARAA